MLSQISLAYFQCLLILRAPISYPEPLAVGRQVRDWEDAITGSVLFYRRDPSVKYSSNPESLLLTILSNPHDLLVRGKIVGPGNSPPLLSVAQTLYTDEFTVIFEFFFIYLFVCEFQVINNSGSVRSYISALLKKRQYFHQNSRGWGG